MTGDHRLKVVQINAVYGRGSTGNMVRDIHLQLLHKGHESIVFSAQPNLDVSVQEQKDLHLVGGRFDHVRHALLWRILRNQGWNSRRATLQMCREIRTLAPDVVHLHNLHSNFVHLGILLRFLADEGIPVVLTLHDCWFFTGGCFHFMKYHACEQWRSECTSCHQYRESRHRSTIDAQFRKKKALFAAIQRLSVVGVSEWISSCARVSAILGNAQDHRVIYNWIDGDVFHPMNTRHEVIQRLGIDADMKIILGVSQGWSDDKGLREFNALAEALAGEAVLMLVGDPNGHPSTETIRFVGYTKNVQELAQLYAAADVFVNPSKMETFGIVTAEALACGTPAVCYANTGTRELVTSQTGALVPDGDIDGMICTVQHVLQQGKASYEAACRARAITMFSKERQIDQYVAAYRSIIGE